MGLFEYETMTHDQTLMTGTIEADSPERATEQLVRMALEVRRLAPAKPARAATAIGRSEFLLFNQQLAAITDAGLPLEKSLRELAGDIQSKALRQHVQDIADELERGDSIEMAFAKRQSAFPPLYGKILQAGVKTGRLSDMLISLNRHLRFSTQTRRMLWQAVAYPLVVVTLAALVLTGVALLVTPVMSGVMAEMDGPIPSSTRIALGMGRYVGPFWIGAGGLVVGCVVLSRVLSATAGGRRLREAVLLRLPILGRLHRRSLLSHFADSLALAISSGQDVTTAVPLAGSAVGSQTLVDDCDRVAAGLSAGESLEQAGARCRLVPRMFWYAARVAGERNQLVDSLYQTSQTYADQARAHQLNLQVMLMPALILFLGVIVGSFIVAMFLPLFHMLQWLQS